MKKPHVVALEKAITIAGSQAALADLMRVAGSRTVSQQTISYWLTNEVFLDPEWWPLMERATDNRITRNDLRPDVFTDRRSVG